MKHGPIFIGGADRCGKTLLRALLAAHPNIAIPAVGSNMWTYFYDQYGDLHQRENFERCLDAMLHYKHVAFLKPDAERIRWEFWQGEPTYARLFALFQEHFAEREGKPRWGDQTGLVERYADPIFVAYPTAKMIHMLRDPRDRYEASLALWPDQKGRVGGATARWLYSANLARRNQKRYPHRYMTVRYEILVTKPEETLRQICAFLDEEFTPSMLPMQGASGYRDNMRNRAESDPEQGGISTAYIGRYRGVIPLTEIVFMQARAKRQMVFYGYPLDAIHFSLRDRLVYACFDWPANYLRMLSWKGIETIQHRFPTQVGRKPAPKMVLKPNQGR